MIYFTGKMLEDQLRKGTVSQAPIKAVLPLVTVPLSYRAPWSACAQALQRAKHIILVEYQNGKQHLDSRCVLLFVIGHLSWAYRIPAPLVPGSQPKHVRLWYGARAPTKTRPDFNITVCYPHLFYFIVELHLFFRCLIKIIFRYRDG